MSALGEQADSLALLRGGVVDDAPELAEERAERHHAQAQHPLLQLVEDAVQALMGLVGLAPGSPSLAAAAAQRTGVRQRLGEAAARDHHLGQQVDQRVEGGERDAHAASRLGSCRAGGRNRHGWAPRARRPQCPCRFDRGHWPRPIRGARLPHLLQQRPQLVEGGEETLHPRPQRLEVFDQVFHGVGSGLQLAQPHHPGVALQGVKLAPDAVDLLPHGGRLRRLRGEQQLFQPLHTLLGLGVEVAQQLVGLRHRQSLSSLLSEVAARAGNGPAPGATLARVSS